MANEGEFPKIDGDVLYSSEVNTFFPKLIGEVTQEFDINISGPASPFVQVGGSILYDAIGENIIHKWLNVRTSPAKTTSASEIVKYRLRISGTDGLNDMVTAVKQISYSFQGNCPFDHFYTSGAITASGGNINSPYVIFLDAGASSTNGVQINDLTVTGF